MSADLLMPGDRFVGESVIDSEFNCQIEAK